MCIIGKCLSRAEVVGDCLEWQGTLDKDGYGVLTHEGRQWRATRLLLTGLLDEPISPHLCVCHSCNNKRCINPDHLYIETPHINSTHAAQDGLYKSKFSGEAVREVLEGKISYREAGLKYGMSIAHYYTLKNRKFVRVEKRAWPATNL